MGSGWSGLQPYIALASYVLMQRVHVWLDGCPSPAHSNQPKPGSGVPQGGFHWIPNGDKESETAHEKTPFAWASLSPRLHLSCQVQHTPGDVVPAARIRVKQSRLTFPAASPSVMVRFPVAFHRETTYKRLNRSASRASPLPASQPPTVQRD